MKTKFYPIPILVFYLLILGTSTAKAQCACADGEVPGVITYNVAMAATISETTISFPKFDPSLGTLNCVVFTDTVSIESTLGIRNMDSLAREYRFLFTIGNTIVGPGIFVDNSEQKNYGPDLLGPYGTPTDSISYGPDTLIKHVINTVINNSNITQYLGPAGTVNFTYSTYGGAIAKAGGTNFLQQVGTHSIGTFSLSYYWCPTTILSGKFKDFSIRNSGQSTRLSWMIANDNNSNRYEIQVSNDGINFITIILAPASANGKYQFDIAAKPEYKYFRIKQTDANGKISYSAVQRQAGAETAALRYFPNPATDQINIQNTANLNGDYSIQLFTAAGQLLHQTSQRIRANSTISMKLSGRPRAGVYYLRIQNNNNPSETFMVNVIFK